MTTPPLPRIGSIFEPAQPPTAAINLGGGVWVAWETIYNEPGEPILWHWCERTMCKLFDRDKLAEWYEPQWVHTGLAVIRIRDPHPLHVAHRVFWDSCCGKSGYIRRGRFTAAAGRNEPATHPPA